MPLLVVAAVVIVALSRSTGSSGPPAALDEATPPHYARQVANCTKVIEKLPIDLGRLKPRIVHTHPESPAVVAWGDPAVILRCGVDKPKSLHPGSSKELRSDGPSTGPYFDIVSRNQGYVWTTVDRAAYISVTIPRSYDGGNIMPTLSRAISSALPAVCAPFPAAGVPTSKLCAERP